MSIDLAKLKQLATDVIESDHVMRGRRYWRLEDALTAEAVLALVRVAEAAQREARNHMRARVIGYRGGPCDCRLCLAVHAMEQLDGGGR